MAVKRQNKVLFYLWSSIFPLFVPAYISVDVGKAKLRKTQVALQPLVLKSAVRPASLKIGSAFFKRLENNFIYSGNFQLIEQEVFLETPGQKSFIPYPQDPKGFIWKNWQLLKTDYLIMGQYSLPPASGNRSITAVQVEIFLYHIPLKRQILHKKYQAPARQMTLLAHQISNDLVQAITGKPGIYLTKIVAVRNMTGSKKELFVMDWDGKNQKQISFHRSIVLSPFWSPHGRFIAYTAFLYQKSKKGRNAGLLLYDRGRNQRRIISNHPGANLGFDFLPSGKTLLGSVMVKGNRNIVSISLDGKIQALTSFMDGSINVEPSLHPQGKSMVFSSDRGGGVMIYAMDFNKKSVVRRLTYYGSYNATPDFSPDGKQIVFSGYDRGRFDIFIMNADGSGIRRLTSVKTPAGRWANHESPSFSPNGRHIVFTSDKTGTYQLYIMNTANFFTKRITYDSYNYKNPRWSPFLNKEFL